MDTFSFSSEKLCDIQSLNLHFDRVKVQLQKNKQPNLIPFHDTYFLITTSVFSKLGTGFFENDDNMFVYYENLGSDDFHLHLVRIFQKQGKTSFKEEIVF